MEDFKFTKSHEWVKIEGDTATIGITDYAQNQLGDIVFIELSNIGDKLKKSSHFGTIESTKAASELYIPLSGEVIEINKELINSPQVINEDPFGKGWMIKVRLEDSSEEDNFLNRESYKEYLEAEDS